MKKIMISACIALMTFSPMYIQGFYAFKSQAEAASYQQTRNEGLQSTATPTTPTNCPVCPTCSTSNSSDYFIPPFNILLGNQTGTTINTHQLNVPNTFALSNAILTVHIFPMSNSINNKTITYAAGTSEGTYIVVYTLKDPAGSMVYKEYDQNLKLANMPHQITLTSIPPATPATTTTTTTPSAGTFSTLSPQPTGMTNAVAQSVFIPPLSTTTYSLANRQQILNGISPLSQKFLLTIDSSGNITAIPISGTFDADDTTTTTLALANNPLSSTTGGTGNTIGAITIQFNDTNTTQLTFDNKSQIKFTDSDLTQGLLLNIVIFPSGSGQSFPVVATLRTSDGLKLRKKAALPAPASGNATTDQPLSSMPTNIAIQYTPTANGAAAIPLLTTSFLNSSMTDNYNAFTIISPLNLRFMIVRNGSSGTNFNVIMM